MKKQIAFLHQSLDFCKAQTLLKDVEVGLLSLTWLLRQLSRFLKEI